MNFCPNGSKIGTVKIKTPLLEHELEGAVYLAAQDANPFGSLVAMYIVAEDPFSGSLIKLAGEVSLNPVRGRSLRRSRTRLTCRLKTSNCISSVGNAHRWHTVALWDVHDEGCVHAVGRQWSCDLGIVVQYRTRSGRWPVPGCEPAVQPVFGGGATNVQAGAFTPLTVTMTRKDGEQNLKSVEANLPPGLLGILSDIELCGEPQANGLCGKQSVGETTISVGVGNEPFTVTGGKFYLTGPYNGHGPCTVGKRGAHRSV